MLRIAIPKGSLEEGTFQLFQEANLKIRRKDSRDYNLVICDPRISESILLRPQEIASYVSEGEFDLGITGRDWIMETESAVKEVANLKFSRGGLGNVKIVLATNNDNPVNNVEDINPESKVVTEYPKITRRYFRKLGKGKIKLRMSYGATEVKVPRLADYLVDVTETGTTLVANGKKILDVILESSTLLIANLQSWNNLEKRQAIEDITELLLGVVRARENVMIKMNISKSKLEPLLSYLPALRSPTLSQLYQCNCDNENWYMVETVVEKSKLNILIPEIKKMGAKDILEVEVSKIIP